MRYLLILGVMLAFVWLVGVCIGGSLRAGNRYFMDWARSVLIVGCAGVVLVWLMGLL